MTIAFKMRDTAMQIYMHKTTTDGGTHNLIIVYVDTVKQIILCLDLPYFHAIQDNNNNQSQITIENSLFFEVFLWKSVELQYHIAFSKKKKTTNKHRKVITREN